MSFSFDFVAKQQDIAEIIAKEHAPASVKEFIAKAITAFKPEALVHVKGVGHLFHNDYPVSNATIMVDELRLRVPVQPSA